MHTHYIHYDPTAEVYELFDTDGTYCGSYDTRAEALAARRRAETGRV